jgi:hypothetical protein
VHTFNVLFVINSLEEIQKACFCSIKEDLFITTTKGKLKKYKIKNGKEIILYREY